MEGEVAQSASNSSVGVQLSPPENITTPVSSENTPEPNQKDLPRLSTPLNLVCFWLFSIFNNAGYYMALGIGLLRYLQWGLSIIDIVKAGMIIYTLQTLTQVIVAIYCDRTVTSFGRRKPFVVVGNLIRYVCVFLLCSPPDFGDRTDYLFAWYVVFNTLSWMGYTIHLNPYQSWLIESTVDDADYVKIRTVALPFGGLIGGISAAVLLVYSPLVAAIYYLIGGMISLICIVSFVPSVCYREQKKQPHIIPSVRMCAQYPDFLKLFWNRVFMESASVTYAALIYFMLATSFHMNNESSIVFVFLLCAIIGGIGGVIFCILCNWIFHYHDRLYVLWGLQLGEAILAFITFFISMSDSPAAFVIYVILCIAMATMGVPLLIITEVLMRDLVVFDTFVTGYNRENMYIAALFIPSSILSQFISAIPVVVVTLTGFKSIQEAGLDDDHIDKNYTWGNGSVWAFRVFSSFFIMLLCLSGFFAMSSFSITKPITQQINQIVKKRELKMESIYLAQEEKQGDAYQQVDSNDQSLPVEVDTKSSTTALSSSKSIETDTAADSIVEGVSDHQRQLLLHLSLPELYRIHSTLDVSPTTTSDVEAPSSGATLPHMFASLRGLVHIARHVHCGLFISFCTMVLYVIALVYDSQRLDGTFSTLLIYILLLVFFYFLYEGFRSVALMELASWSVNALHDLSKLTYAEFSAKLADVHTLLAKEHHINQHLDIHHSSELGEQEGNSPKKNPEAIQSEVDHSSLGQNTTREAVDTDPVVDSNKVVFEIDQEMESIANKSVFIEDHVASTAFDSMLGYRLVYLTFVIIVGFAIFVIVYAVV